MTSTLHQFVPTLQRSAVGDHVLEVQRVCRELGLRSEIFAEVVWPDMAKLGRSFSDYGRTVKAQPDDVLLYHVAQGAGMADALVKRPQALVVDHHNITPARFFTAWDPAIVPGLLWGRRQLASLSARATLGIADSSFNRSELDDLGLDRTDVVPILLDTDTFAREVDERAVDRLRTDDTVWLFVSRIVPNKAQHDLVKALAVYRRVYDPTARLRIVGSDGTERYLAALHQFIDRLGLTGAVDVTLGSTHAELAAHYRSADVYVSASEHEGFSVTLLEAMHHRLPIVAYASTAVPETLGDGGLLLPTKDPATMAAAVWRVTSDAVLHEALIARGSGKLADFALPVTRKRLVDALAPVL